jgi:TonB family protein
VQPASASKPDDARELSRELSEDQLRQQLVGKPLMLRGGYLGDSLSFNEHGSPVGHPAVGSYTLSAVEIEKVHLTKHKVELIGARYGLHFLGALPYDDPAKTMDRVKITPKKKVLKITIDREQVVKPRKEKEKKSKSAPAPKAAGPATALSNASPDSPETAPSTSAATPAAAPAPTEADQAKAAADETKADIAATPDAERPADAASQTTTTSQSHANQVLRDALDRIFAPGLDERMMSQIPQFWQLYYKAQAAGVDYRPQDPNVLRSSAVDQQAKLTSPINPDSNDFAQENGIAGRALYRVVVGADGKPGEIAVVRPIGFGLDENAVAAIGKASFQPAMKGGKPAAETLDLAVVFRIYSKRTSVAAKTPADNSTAVAQPAKPGPYTVRQQPQQPQQSQ